MGEHPTLSSSGGRVCAGAPAVALVPAAAAGALAARHHCVHLRHHRAAQGACLVPILEQTPNPSHMHVLWCLVCNCPDRCGGGCAPAQGVMLSHANLRYQVDNLSYFLPLKAGERSLSLLPPWHIYERSCSYYILSRACCQARCSACCPHRMRYLIVVCMPGDCVRSLSVAALACILLHACCQARCSACCPHRMRYLTACMHGTGSDQCNVGIWHAAEVASECMPRWVAGAWEG
jgi:hypothetical protein